jgi:transposase
VEKKFAVDSTGFSTSIKDNWVITRFKQKELEKINYRKWKKLHIITGIVSNIIVSATVTKGYSADSPQFQGLVSDTASNFQISELSADPAYLSKNNVRLVTGLGGIPYIMPKSNTSFKNRSGGAWIKMIRMWRDNRDEFKRHYHLRSNVESTFSMIKRKFSDKLRSKKDQSQKNEILAKIVCHNISVLVNGIFELNLELNWN